MFRGMFRSGSFWADYFDSIFIPDIDAYASCLIKRLLPSFENLDNEANRIEQKEYERLCSSWGHDEYVDSASLAERAMNKAIAYMQTISGIQQGLINLFGAGLYHLFEQQLLFYHRRELLIPTEENRLAFLKGSKTHELLAANGIDITFFTSWARLDELRLLANAVKHADGQSCAQLRVQRPDLFCSPISVETGFPFVRSVVYQPLAGEGIYLNEVEFKRYVEDVKAFWSELGQRLIERDKHNGLRSV